MPRFVVPALACLFSVFGLHAQEVIIRGIVTDVEAGTPVAGAKVELNYFQPNFPLDTAETTAAGTFELKVKESGKYSVAASAPGYREAVFDNERKGVVVADSELEPGASAVDHKVELKLSRSTVLTGLIRDAETKQPIPRVVVRAIRLWWWHGIRQATEERLGFTGEDGVFRFESLPPAEYVFLLGNTTPGINANRPKAYPILVWPEGDPDAVLPLTVKSGFEVSVGTIDYSKVVLPRIHAPACTEQAMTDIRVGQRVVGAWFKLSNGAGNICSELQPTPAISHGTYRLTFTSEYIRIASEELHLRDGEDAEAKVNILPGATITGKVTCECEKSLNKTPEPISVTIQPSPGDAGYGTSAQIRSDGTFSLPDLISGIGLIGVRNIPEGLAVKGMLDAGVLVSITPGSALTIDIVCPTNLRPSPEPWIGAANRFPTITS